MQVYFSEDQTGQRYAQTEGLQTRGQQELAVPLFWQQGDQRDQQIIRLLKVIGQYIYDQPKRITAGQTMQYGWSMLRFVPDQQHGLRQETLLIEELQRPFGHGDSRYVPGAAQAIHLLWLQEEAIRRNRITGESEPSHRSHLAIVCSRVTPETTWTLRPLCAERLWQPDNRYSGWFIGCSDKRHDHNNPDELAPIHLLHLLEGLPAIFPYLLMPVGTALFFEAQQVIIFGPGEQEGHVDTEPPATTLPLT